jgi:hypothetical protein
MEYNEFYEDESKKGGRRYKKDTTKRTLNLGIFNGADLMDRIVKLFRPTDSELSKRNAYAKMYEEEKNRGRVGINVSTMYKRKKLMSADVAQLLPRSYTISHDPRNNGDKMEFTYKIDNNLFFCQFKIQIDYVTKMILLLDGEFYSECFPTPLNSESELLDERNTFFEVEGNNSVAKFSSKLIELLVRKSGGERVDGETKTQLQIEISELVLNFLSRMFKEKINMCDEVELKFNRKKKPYNKLDENVNRILELFRLLD